MDYLPFMLRRIARGFYSQCSEQIENLENLSNDDIIRIHLPCALHVYCMCTVKSQPINKSNFQKQISTGFNQIASSTKNSFQNSSKTGETKFQSSLNYTLHRKSPTNFVVPTLYRKYAVEFG